MLGKYGETLVVDWGLAKAVHEYEPEHMTERPELPLKPSFGTGVEPTLVGSALGTPAYMSPEQVDSRIGEPALEAICMKALALKPDDRYDSAQALKADLERILAGEPVSCYRESILQRMWRSGRRNPWVARAVGLATVFFILLFIFTSILFAVLGLFWAILGAFVGALAGALQGEARLGARRGAELGFQIGTIVAIVVFLFLGILVMVYPSLSEWLLWSR
jgi:hypothetical protein